MDSINIILLKQVFIISENISFPNVKVSKYQHTTLIALNRPDDKNRLNAATLGDLKNAILNFENDSSSTIGILYGEGGSFCAGLDPEEIIKEPQIYDVIIHVFLINFVL